MNDALRTNVFVRYQPETIACACIFLSARQLKVKCVLPLHCRLCISKRAFTNICTAENEQPVQG